MMGGFDSGVIPFESVIPADADVEIGAFRIECGSCGPMWFDTPEPASAALLGLGGALLLLRRRRNLT